MKSRNKKGKIMNLLDKRKSKKKSNVTPPTYSQIQNPGPHRTSQSTKETYPKAEDIVGIQRRMDEREEREQNSKYLSYLQQDLHSQKMSQTHSSLRSCYFSMTCPEAPHCKSTRNRLNKYIVHVLKCKYIEEREDCTKRF
jgi:hypothetical protein